MWKLLYLINITIIITGSLYAQPELDIRPGDIEFRDLFDRLENVYFINKGDDTLVIDTIYYKSDLYFVRFDKYSHYPIQVPPGDTLLMDCILSGYFNVTADDTIDTMFISSNSEKGMEAIRVRIRPFDDSHNGHLTGTITDGTNPIPYANVYLIFDGNYIIKTLKTNSAGKFYSEVPEGRFTVSASKDSFYTVFSGQTKDPYSAQIFYVGDDSTVDISIQLDRISYTNNRVSGIIKDGRNATALKKAMVVIRKGNHNPRKIDAASLEEKEAFTVFTDSEGNFSAEVADPGYYYIQSFSDYFLPTFYSTNNSTVFWEQADSIEINAPIDQKDIYMPRDSSYGYGTIEGKIIFPTTDTISNVLVFAQSVENNYLYSYAFSKDGGEFRLTNLPYGSYKLFGQKIGYDNSYYNNTVEIKPGTPALKDVYIRINTSDVGENDVLPQNIELYQNYPNPFNPSTTIEFFLPYGTAATLSIFNLLGEEIRVLHDGFLPNGSHKFDFNANNLSSGTYFARLKTSSGIQVRKILLLK